MFSLLVCKAVSPSPAIFLNVFLVMVSGNNTASALDGGKDDLGMSVLKGGNGISKFPLWAAQRCTTATLQCSL